MKHSQSGFLIMSLLALVLVFPTVVMGQKLELNPYVAYSESSRSSAGTLKNANFYGIRAGAFLDSNVELEGQFGYINHFQVRGTGAPSRGLLWNGGMSFNFSTDDFPFSHRFAPFLVIDAGGITTDTSGYSYSIPGNLPLANGTVLDTTRTISVRSHDTFFNVSYGAGIKSIKLWGPVGIRAEIRGRTIPNYYHGAPTWVEGSVGLNFVFGALKPY